LGFRAFWCAVLLLCLALVPQAAFAAGVDLRRSVCTAALANSAGDAAVTSAPYRCGANAATRSDAWLWLRLDTSSLRNLPPNWNLLVDQTRFRRIAIIVEEGDRSARMTQAAGALERHWAPGGLLKFAIPTPGHDVRGLYLGFQKIDDLSLMRKIIAAPAAAAPTSDARWLLLMGLFAGTMLSALLYNLVIHAGQRNAFQRWYLLWVAVALAYGLVWTNMVAFVVPGLAGPAAVRLDYVLVGLMVWAGNMFFFALIEEDVLPRVLLIVGRALAVAGFLLGFLAAIDGWLPAMLTDRLLNYVIAATAVTVALSCWIAVRRGSRVIWFYLIGWGPAIGVFLARLARNLGLLPQNDLVDKATFAALAFEALVLSLAIADRFRLMRQELEDSRQRREIDLVEAKALRLAARTDFLTGLDNRAAFQNEAHDLIARGTPFSLFLIDVDYLKDANDRFGHAGGDALLRRIGSALAEIGKTLPQARVARIGGDEFAILCPGDSGPETGLAQRIEELQDENWHFLGQERSISLSVGSARYPDDAEALDLLYQNADLALYNAKRLGRARHYRYDPLQRILHDLQIEFTSDADVALLRGEFCLHYQPLVSLSTSQVEGYEALLRWNHPDHGLMRPDRFADVLVAEKIGLRIQEHVLELALLWLREHGDRVGMLSVNFTSAQLSGPRAARRVLDRLAHHGVPPSSLCVEVTEGVMLDRAADTILTTLRALHAAGVCIALDDFGTGFASLVHLRQMPVDRIKIDRSFVAGIDEHDDGGTLAIVRAIIGLGRGLGKVVVAEGIETEAQAHRLRQLGCQLGQGYLYGRPEPELVNAGPPETAAAVARLRQADARRLRMLAG
jgi:diguanylate cyclase (GGDEF)-like protein